MWKGAFVDEGLNIKLCNPFLHQEAEVLNIKQDIIGPQPENSKDGGKGRKSLWPLK